MDPGEIIKHAPDLLKGGAAVAGALKLTDVVKAMLGPATAEFAERLRDDVRLYRYGRQLECLKKAEKMATDAGFTPKAVPIKILFPLLEGASLEEDEDLHTMWAALLANAALPEKGANVRPGFIALLKEMAPDEAVLLKAFAESPGGYFLYREEPDMDQQFIDADYKLAKHHLRHIFGRPDESDRDMQRRYRQCLGFLDKAGLIVIAANREIELSYLGEALRDACAPPKPKS